MRIHLLMLPLIALFVVGCSNNHRIAGRKNSTWERFLLHEKDVAMSSSRATQRTLQFHVNKESFADDWRRIVGAEKDLITSPPRGRDSASGRFLRWEKENAKTYSRDTQERFASMARPDVTKPFVKRLFKEETSHTWYAAKDNPYRGEHPYTRRSTFRKLINDDKEVAEGAKHRMKSYRESFKEDVDSFGDHFEKFISKLYQPLDI